jgi:hypothetical protein
MQFTGLDGKLDDHQFDTVYGELHTSGKVHKNVSWVLNFNANGQGARNTDRNQQLPAGIEDAIIGLDLADEFHLWVGQLLTPVDRTNASGPFFTIPWSYTGVFAGSAAGFVGPRGEDVYGRSTGAVLWGDVGGNGKFKYFLSSMNMRSLENRPLFSGRVVATPIGSEKGFWGNSTWDGAQDVLAFGIGAQYQKEGNADVSPTSTGGIDTYTEFNGDAVAEFGVGGGYLTAEVGGYFFGGDFKPYDNMFYGLVSYASPFVGPGRLQPMFRVQMATAADNGFVLVPGVTAPVAAADLKKYEFQVGYLVKGAALRGIIGYSTTDVGADKNVNALQFAAQTIF